MLADGEVFWGKGAGAPGISVGEVCFNTSMTGYQEILTDPSYAGQLISFTFPHIGNVGVNPEDMETKTPAARGFILREEITEPANWRAARHLDDWLKSIWLTCVTGVDTRRLTHRIRDGGAPNGAGRFFTGSLTGLGLFRYPLTQQEASCLFRFGEFDVHVCPKADSMDGLLHAMTFLPVEPDMERQHGGGRCGRAPRPRTKKIAE